MTALELRVPPVAATAAFAGLMWLVAAFMPLLTYAIPGRVLISVILVAAGAAVGLSGVVAFRRASTTVNPFRPDRTSALLTSGVYRYSRNPMYLGLLFALLGLTVWLAHLLAPLLAVGFVAYMSRFQIVPEERALRSTFGAAFDEYASRTRRWL